MATLNRSSCSAEVSHSANWVAQYARFLSWWSKSAQMSGPDSPATRCHESQHDTHFLSSLRPRHVSAEIRHSQ